MPPKRQRTDLIQTINTHKSLGTYERLVKTRSVSANCKISSVHDFVKVLPNHSLEEREIDDVENEALVSAFLAEKVDPFHEFTPSLRAIHGGSFQGCTAPGDKYTNCDDVVFPTEGVSDAIVIVSDELDMMGVGEQLQTLSDTAAFVREIWKISRTVMRMSNDYAFMHNDLHAKNIVLNRATKSLFMIDFGRSVINLKGWNRAQLILDDLKEITNISCTPAMVRKRIGKETGLHWIPTPSQMPKTCLWSSDICMFSMSILQTYLQTYDKPTLSLPFATLSLQEETHSPYSEDAWKTPQREIRIRLSADMTDTNRILEAAKVLLEDNIHLEETERAVISVTLVGATIAAIMIAHDPSHERLFFGESSQIDRAPDLTPNECRGILALWELASSYADAWEDDVRGGGADQCQPHGLRMLAAFFPSSMTEAYVAKPPLARGIPINDDDMQEPFQYFAPVPMTTGFRAQEGIQFPTHTFPHMSPTTVMGGGQTVPIKQTSSTRHRESHDNEMSIGPSHTFALFVATLIMTCLPRS